MSIVVRRSPSVEPSRAAAASRAALDLPLADEAELWITSPARDAIMLGAFQRGAGAPLDAPLVRRGSGGPSVRVGSGTLHVVLALRDASALTACDAPRLVNRYVRPLLRALTRAGATAHYFGRDWISVKHRPAAYVGFAHDRASGRAMVEALIALRTPFDLGARASFMGKEPGTVEAIAGIAIDRESLANHVVEAYAAAYGRAVVDGGAFPEVPASEEDLRLDPPWLASVDEAIGPVCAGPDRDGRMRVGGDLLASRDAIAHLEEALASRDRAASADAREAEVARVIDLALAAPGVALDGVRSLSSVRDVVLRAIERDEAAD